MDNSVGTRLEQDLRTALSRLRRIGGAVGVDKLPEAIGANACFADEVDGIQAHESREIDFATRELLRERVNRLSEAIDRLNGGAYGTCTECGEPISRARLQAMPEVQTCVRCQDGLERHRFAQGETEPDARVTLPAPPLPARLL